MDKRVAIQCARIARLAYGVTGTVDGFEYRGKFDNAGTNTQGIFGILDDEAFVLAFRGSEESGVADWLTDLKFIQKAYPYTPEGDKQVKVHGGFIWAYESVRDAVQHQIRENKLNKVVLTGHSLGAALATLASFDFKVAEPDKEVHCYTFGSPKVGNRKFVDAYNRRVPDTFRFVNGSDLIPRLPPMGYDHVGLLHLLGELIEDEKVLAKVENHLPNNYIRAVQEMNV